MNRKIISRIHPIAGILGLTTISLFWISTLLSKFSGDADFILSVKTMIVYGLFILVPSMAIVGFTGAKLGGKSKNPKILAKKKRMPFIALNGMLILVPCAIILYFYASKGDYNFTYNIIQWIELLAGTINITLLSMSARDGLSLTKRFKKRG